MTGSIRDDIAKVLYLHTISDHAGENVPEIATVCESAADAIIARYPWIAEQPHVEYGHSERKSDEPFDPDFAHVYPGATHSPATHWHNVRRYVTEWREVR